MKSWQPRMGFGKRLRDLHAKTALVVDWNCGTVRRSDVLLRPGHGEREWAGARFGRYQRMGSSAGCVGRGPDPRGCCRTIRESARDLATRRAVGTRFAMALCAARTTTAARQRRAQRNG